MTTEQAAYVKSLRNKAKREYAIGWIAYLNDDAPPPSGENLSVMGAQAVRLRLGCK